jgi:hypothetical protein
MKAVDQRNQVVHGDQHNTVSIETGGSKCYYCDNAAKGQCSKCGRFYCRDHASDRTGKILESGSHIYEERDKPVCIQCRFGVTPYEKAFQMLSQHMKWSKESCAICGEPLLDRSTAWVPIACVNLD